MQQSSDTCRKPTYDSIQYLRAVAALGVVAFHASPVGYPLMMGNAGVDVFFVVSGFLMWTITDARPQSPMVFLQHRLVRIVPLYWFITALLVAGATAMPAMFPNLKFDLPFVLGSLFFVPMRPPGSAGTGAIWPVLVQGWTLNYEFLFYVLFAFCLFVKRSLRLPVLSGLIIGAVLCGRFYDGTNAIVMCWTDPLMLEFLAGVWIAASLQSGIIFTRNTGFVFLGFAAVLLGMVGMTDGTPLRIVLWGIPAILLVWGAVTLERNGTVPNLPWLRVIGDSSYSLYLTHGLVLSVLGKLMGHSWLFLIVGLIGATMAGLVFYYLTERPLTRIAQRLIAGNVPSAGRSTIAPS